MIYLPSYTLSWAGGLSMAYRIGRVGELKVGSYAVIDGEPCQILSIQKSKPGKHGSAKFRCIAVSLLDGSKKSFVSPVDATIEIPIVDKRRGQIVSITPDYVQLMDLETYEVFEVPQPSDEELKSRLEVGREVEYWNIMGHRKLVRVKG